MSLFSIRLWLGDQLFRLAAWVMPEHRYNHSYDGETISIWREPV